MGSVDQGDSVATREKFRPATGKNKKKKEKKETSVQQTELEEEEEGEEEETGPWRRLESIIEDAYGEAQEDADTGTSDDAATKHFKQMVVGAIAQAERKTAGFVNVNAQLEKLTTELEGENEALMGETKKATAVAKKWEERFLALRQKFQELQEIQEKEKKKNRTNLAAVEQAQREKLKTANLNKRLEARVAELEKYSAEAISARKIIPQIMAQRDDWRNKFLALEKRHEEADAEKAEASRVALTFQKKLVNAVVRADEQNKALISADRKSQRRESALFTETRALKERVLLLEQQKRALTREAADEDNLSDFEEAD